MPPYTEFHITRHPVPSCRPSPPISPSLLVSLIYRVLATASLSSHSVHEYQVLLSYCTAGVHLLPRPASFCHRPREKLRYLRCMPSHR